MDPAEVVQDALDFLCGVGLAQAQGGERYIIGNTRIHLGKGSPLLSKHHMNWRLRCLLALEDGRREDLHYSSVISISLADSRKLKEMALGLLERTEPIVRASPEEEAFVFAVDFFQV